MVPGKNSFLFVPDGFFVFVNFQKHFPGLRKFKLWYMISEFDIECNRLFKEFLVLLIVVWFYCDKCIYHDPLVLTLVTFSYGDTYFILYCVKNKAKGQKCPLWFTTVPSKLWFTTVPSKLWFTTVPSKSKVWSTHLCPFSKSKFNLYEA